MAHAELGKHGIDGPDLNACPAACIANTCCANVILAVRLNER